MRRLLLFITLSILLVGVGPSTCGAEVQAGLKIDDEGVKSFYLSVGEHYHAPEAQLVAVRERHIPDEELPVVFFISSRARVTPEALINLHLKGLSWMEISLRFGLDASTYYVDAGEVSGPPFGHAYGHYKNRPKDRWKEIRLSDDDIVSLVNLRFVSDHYGYKPAEVVKLRKESKSFVQVNRTVKERKQGLSKQKYAADDKSNNGKDNAKGKGNGKDKKGDKKK